jgi:hypothetical protein
MNHQELATPSKAFGAKGLLPDKADNSSRTYSSRIIVNQPDRVFQVLRHISINERIPETF